ncbi:N-acetylgalactosaminyltransferase 6-like [Hyposmocoma kahamanoa]|uniref:N-acetylgalactosaminyltransferase 6-like n=1 Tax=Hyposmocoma kahamanoa TaxID=1477025 RepID=UPI000E6D5AD3|nr:N-acetylgalactosaminyltransferase 6-like [Hyposmocoma kahamanoa]
MGVSVQVASFKAQQTMIVLRRQLLRLLRLRNLIACTVLLILLYILRTRQELDFPKLQYGQEHALAHSKSDHFVPRSTKKIDWHDHVLIQHESERVGIGEQGKPAFLLSKDKALEEELYSVNGFNGALSDKIALNRSLPDIRHRGCKHRKYLEDLPTVSVIVPFHNEHWSTLLRTAFTVLYRSPKKLIKEIFLVDDASTKDFLKEKLDSYLEQNIPKARVIRVHNRSGLITARLAGAKEATGDVLIFLDSHTEANVNWLPPLLEPIALNYRTVVCPFIDVIAYDTFEYRPQDEGARGAFDWEFFYKRLPVLPKDKKNMPEPFESPVMAGGLFAISRKFFWELGGYDPGLDIWGGEQYELSFKIWQCGGRMVDAPCSRVGHIYRKFAPFPNPGHGDFVGKNYRRVAEVWMDEYSQYLYKRRPHYLKIDPGDLTAQKAIRTKLKCKPFKWFITQIAFDLPVKYPMIEPEPFGSGQIKTSSGNRCVDAKDTQKKDKITLSPCDSNAGRQKFILSWHKDIRMSSQPMCWDVPESKPRSPVLLYSCHLGGGNQLWRYLPDTKQFRHSSGTCLDHDEQTFELFVNRCDSQRSTQQWQVAYNKQALDKWDDIQTVVTGPLPYEDDIYT